MPQTSIQLNLNTLPEYKITKILYQIKSHELLPPEVTI